jgi:hypothetical protein
MRLVLWFAVLVLASTSMATAATPAPSAPPAAHSVGPISQTELDEIYAVLYTTIRRAKFVLRPANLMPANDPLVHFDRLDGGHAQIWVERTIVRQPRGSVAGNDAAVAATGALALGAIEAGSAGSAWKARMDRTKDWPALSHAIGTAFAERSDRQIAESHANVEWVHANFKPGMTEDDAYAKLAARHLAVTRTNRDLTIGYSLGFDAGCMNQTQQVLSFDGAHHLTTITENPQTRCQ